MPMPCLARFVRLTVGSIVAAGAAQAATLAEVPVAPFTWQTATPESQGMATARLDAWRDRLAAHHTVALLVVRHDRIVYEWYAPGTTASTKLGTASAAKGLVGGMAAAVAINDGLIHLTDRAAQYIPQWRDDPLKSKITLRELGDHTSGLDDAEIETPGGEVPHDQLTGWQGDFWKRRPVPRDPFTISRDLTPMLYPPGQHTSYSNPAIGMLMYAVTVALRDSHAPEPDIRTLLRDRVMRPIGVADRDWQAGYGETDTVDGLPLVADWGGGSYTARAMAQIGRLMLREGDWDGRRLLTREAVRAVSQGAGTPHPPPRYSPGDGAIGWWANREGRIPDLPRDAYYAAGAGNRLVIVIPSLQAIVVRNGLLLDPAMPYFEAENQYVFIPAMEVLGVPVVVPYRHRRVDQ